MTMWPHRLSVGLAMAAWMAPPTLYPRTALADAPPRVDAREVSIEGGPDATGDSYVWTITNRHSSPIVYVEFPHYQATLFFAPEGWSTHSTFLVNVGVKAQPGVCSARADAPSAGIPPGGTGTFRMQIHQSGTRQGSGTVLVRFADGDEMNLPGVSVPIREALSDRYGSLIGLSVIFVLLAVIQARRRAAARRAAPPASRGGGLCQAGEE